MTSTFARYFLALTISVSLAAMAQTGAPAGGAGAPAAGTGAAPAAAVPSAPSAASAAAASPAALNFNGTRIASINIEQAIIQTNEGQRDFTALSKKLEPKQTELKSASDEIESLKKQFTNQQEKMNDDARANLQKQIEGKQKLFDRSVQDAREEAQNEQNVIAQRILQKLFPVLAKYASTNNVGMVIDTSQQWPQGPVIFSGDAMDITKPVVEAYNAQSGVPAPPPGTAKPAARPAPTAPSTKPATTPSTKPAAPSTTTPPKPQGKQ